MYSFILAIVALIAGYFIYGKFIERYFGADSQRPTPVKTMEDGVDYKELKPWRIFVIQFLNIAGLGPIFGAILGAAYGLMSYVWIVVGCIFMGAVHDYMSGMLSIRHEGKGLPDIVGTYLGTGVSKFMSIFTGLLLLAVGVSFVNGPAGLMQTLTGWSMDIWLYIIFLYYILATMIPIDKIIGKVYPFMGAILIFMAVAVGAMILYKGFAGEIVLPELSLDTLRNGHANPEVNILFPMLFVVISCGAISGFHATQSPLMARCMSNEKYGRPIFYGAMVAEGVVALIWATAAIAYCGGIEGLNASGKTPAVLVNEVCTSWLGKTGAVIAILGVVVCPITSGDTAFRSMRLIIADALKYNQKPILNRIIVSAPIFVLAYLLTQYDFSLLWNYVGISNQILATITLWTCSVYLFKVGKKHWFTSISAVFLTWVCATYFLIAPHKAGGLSMNHTWSFCMGAAVALAVAVVFFINISGQNIVKKKKIIIWSMIIGLIIAGFIFYPRSGDSPTAVAENSGEMLVGEDSSTVAAVNYKYGLPIDNFDVIYGNVERGETLSTILIRRGVTAAQVDKLVKICTKDVFDVRTVRLGQAYACIMERDSLSDRHKLEYFVYENSDEGYVLFDLRNDGAYKVTRGFYPVEWRRKTVAGKVESSLWNAMKRCGSEPVLAIDLAHIFGWSIDFFGLQKEDEFKVIYNQKYVEGDPLNSFDILAARFTSNGKTVNAIPFEQDSTLLYFDENGNSLEGAFLKAPLDYYRITSKFTNSRFHPILKRYRAHHGVDYAAPAGTPVYAIGSGKVIARGYQRNGGGNYIKIRHNSTYTTSYMHLLRFAKGLTVGKHVEQKEVIGYVGSTGLSTGPHLDFRVYENGTPINPLTIKSQPKAPVKAELRPQFNELRDSVMNILDSLVTM